MPKSKEAASLNAMLEQTAAQDLKTKINARLTIARKSEECEIVRAASQPHLVHGVAPKLTFTPHFRGH